MSRKYCRSSSPLTSVVPARSSPTWKRLSRTWALAHPHIRWVIGDGSAYFWDDIWIGEVPIRTLSLDDRGASVARISDFWQEGTWSSPKLQLLHEQAGLPQAVIDDILEVPILAEQKDTPRWSLSSHGNFTLSSAWELGRSRRPIVPLLEDIWNKSLTASMSIFLWRLVANRIPVDTKLQWRGIELASKCHCCISSPDIESLQHLFISGHGAVEVWREFDGWFPGQTHRLHPSDSIPDRLLAWSRRLEHGEVNHLSRSLPCLILWFLWAERNNSRHNVERFRPHNVSWQVLMHLRRLVSNGVIGPSQWQGCLPTAGLGDPPARSSRVHLPVPVKWHPPDAPWTKLNVAGVLAPSHGNGFGGGVLRDHHGYLLCAFRVPLITSSSWEAELRAISHGLTVAQQFGRSIWIETDSRQVASLLTNGKLGPARTRFAAAKILGLLKELNFKSSHIPRAGNKIAHSL